jgi:predicted HD superfamily hydrolase involved in NAD metabolism
MEELENVSKETMELLNKILEDMKKTISEKRITHCLNVMKKCVELANIHNVDVNNAALAGLTHDIAKEISFEDSLKIAKENGIEFDDYEINIPSLIHGKMGAFWVKKYYNLNIEIQHAIEYHTITNPEMDDLAKILYIADKIEDGRVSNDYNIEYEREMSKTNLDEAMIVILSENLSVMIKKGKLIHPQAIKTRNALILKQKNK